MHSINFYPVGNGDTSQIILNNGKRILFDFRHLKRNEDDDSFNLKKNLQKELEDDSRDYFDVVAFTHCDKDHIENSTEFFELLHAEKYKGDGRIKIDQLWVPASMILETATNDQQSNEFVIWRQEARFRLKEGKGIRVFSKPDKLKDWLTDNGLTVESRKHLITDAGQLVPEFTIGDDGVEFFCHSPFIKHVDEGDDLRNDAALIFNVRFKAGLNYFDYLLVGDTTWKILEDIVSITKSHNNEDRLAWDLYNIPHHCSYLALSDDKGKYKTVPKPLVKELLLSGNENAYMISSSNPINDDKEGREQSGPPHIQAKKCYEEYLELIDGANFKVTMEEPSINAPDPLIFEITSDGIKRGSIKTMSAAAVITSSRTQRAG